MTLWERLKAGETIKVYHVENDPECHDPFSITYPTLAIKDEIVMGWISKFAVVDDKVVQHTDGLWYPYIDGRCTIELIPGKGTGYSTEEIALSFLNKY